MPRNLDYLIPSIKPYLNSFTNIEISDDHYPDIIEITIEDTRKKRMTDVIRMDRNVFKNDIVFIKNIFS